MFFELFVPTIGVLLFGIFLLILINLCYRFLIKQDEAGRAKDRIKEIGDEMKHYRNDKQRTSELMTEMMKENNKIMKMTLKPMILSFLIVLMLLPILAGTYGDHYATLQNSTGNITIDSTYFELQKDGALLMKSSDKSYTCEMPCRLKLDTEIPSQWNIGEEGDRVTFGRVVALLPFTLPWVDDDAGWILWYLIVSIPLMIIIRKAMGIKV
ncbi:MAG: DUF106 domain-containing protein [Candidatus Aenigmarchaeota archaeon]|nr:DUF106 domain-containing protein [Candidatus Aenigmarchaeota archaeon]